MLYAVVVAVLVALDQVVKALVRSNLALGESVPLIPHVLQLTYVQNTGAAFSSFSNSTFLLGVISAVISVGLIVVLAKKIVRHPAGRWLVALVLAGAIGNMLDRFVLGYVTDMFQTLFIRFAVFNVADVYVVVGVILLAVYVLFFWDKLEKRPEKPAGETDGQP